MATLNVTTITIGSYGVVLWLHGTVDPSREDWERGLHATTRLCRSLGGDLTKLRSLVVTDGAAPNSAQRKQMSEEVFDDKPYKLAVITNSLDNPIKRGVATALAWMNPTFLAVTPDRWRDALRHLDLADHALPIVRHYQELQKTFQPVDTLAHLTRLVQTELRAH